MRDDEILSRISALVTEEHELRGKLSAGEVTSEEENARVKELEVALDQCWDLLRQRRARRGAGEDPDAANARPASEVEGYRQ
ncbi:DUF2630 family protein [Nonomuraea rhodomycinica]|uniref:DUF2630 family protein n=1 Tax=Nonomuraea rhodomycinica TaxID=1712872 RepID=A0A7Y6IM56_9ACTN|nr:DUF2630 family protein [Nonomuraea rhodomycinica]NUW40330.1 DUF2630 family protein [Nonomuraea rhodomycinica]